MTDLSIIVPVYNVEKYLDECVESLLAQGMEDFEIILVDDGSTDSSGMKCDEYSARFDFIRTIHKPNGGLSDARNAGLREARGEYILFVDSDDYLVAGVLPVIIAKALENDADILALRGTALYDDGRMTSYISPRGGELSVPHTGANYMARLMSAGEWCCAVPFALYRRELITANDLYFKVGILHEDNLWTPQVYLAAGRVLADDTEFYIYRQREGSITHRADMAKNAIDVLGTCRELKGVFDCVEDAELRRIFYDYTAGIYMFAIYNGRMYRREYRKYIDTAFLGTLVCGGRNALKYKLLKLSPRLYCAVNSLLKSH